MTNYRFSFYKMAAMALEAPLVSILDTENAKSLFPNYHSFSFSKIEPKDIGLAASFDATYEFFPNPNERSKAMLLKLSCKLEPIDSRGYSLHLQKGDQSNSGDFKTDLKSLPWQDKTLIKIEGSIAVSNLFAWMVPNSAKDQISGLFQKIFERALVKAGQKNMSEQEQSIISNMLSLHES